MSFIFYIIILVALAFMLPGIVGAAGTTGMLWGEGISHVAKWSLYSMEAATVLMLIAAIHFFFAKVSLRKLVRPVFVLIMGIVIIPLNTGFLNFSDGLNDTQQATGPFANMSHLLSDIVEMMVRHGTGVLGLAVVSYAVWMISNNRPQRGFMKNLFKN